MDLALFGVSSAMAAVFVAKRARKNCDDDDEQHDPSGLYLVDKENHDYIHVSSSSNAQNKTTEEATRDEKYASSTLLPWYRASYILVMHEPPNMYYEPREWTHTSVLLIEGGEEQGGKFCLPGGPNRDGESYQECAVRRLLHDNHIDVCQPENCLHHLFTFPLPHEAGGDATTKSTPTGGVWADFYECVFRGNMDKLKGNLESFLISDLKTMVDDQETCKDRFVPETCHALKLYFQRQGDLYVKRRLLKSYSTVDLEHYGLRNESFSGDTKKIVFLDTNSFQRQEAVDFTMKTDDGMSPKLLPQADIVLLGVSRAGKSPLSLYLAQTTGLKVSNVPLVQELSPPQQLSLVDPKRVFCLTMDARQLQTFRMTRFRREMKKQLPGQQNCIYADSTYVEKDLEHARSLARSEGYTELNVTNRAMEETAALIILKMKERFPDMHII